MNLKMKRYENYLPIREVDLKIRMKFTSTSPSLLAFRTSKPMGFMVPSPALLLVAHRQKKVKGALLLHRRYAHGATYNADTDCFH